MAITMADLPTTFHKKKPRRRKKKQSNITNNKNHTEKKFLLFGSQSHSQLAQLKPRMLKLENSVGPWNKVDKVFLPIVHGVLAIVNTGRLTFIVHRSCLTLLLAKLKRLNERYKWCTMRIKSGINSQSFAHLRYSIAKKRKKEKKYNHDMK